MTTYGITDAGFVRKRLADILAELQEDARQTFGASINLADESPLGQLLGIFSERLNEIWQLAEDTYYSAYPVTATGVSLDNALTYSGLERKGYTKSTVTAAFVGTAATVIPAGSVASVAGNPTARFVTDLDITLDGTGHATGTLTAETAGAVGAPSTSLTVIETPVSGWTSISNPLDALVGDEIETDAMARSRYEASKQKSGSGTVEAIRADVLQLAGVEAALVFENDTDVVDGNGRPPHSFEVVVQGGDEAEIALLIWQDKPAGIETYGSVTHQITDSQGFTRDIKFSRPTLVLIYVAIDLTTNSLFPADGTVQVKAAIIEYAATLTLGSDVIIIPAMVSYLRSIPGIVGAVIHVGIAPAPTGTVNIDIDDYELAVFDTSRVSVNVL